MNSTNVSSPCDPVYKHCSPVEKPLLTTHFRHWGCQVSCRFKCLSETWECILSHLAKPSVSDTMYFAYDVLATLDRPAHQLHHVTNRMSQKLCSAYVIFNPGIFDVELLTQLRL